MKTIHFASSNPEKIAEARQILGRVRIKVIPAEMELNEIRSEDQERIAIEKAKSAFLAIKKPVIAEDTGVYFNAYVNFPGVFPAFIFKAMGYGGLLRLLRGKDRGAHFKTVVAYHDGKNIKTFVGICRGTITKAPDSPAFRNQKLPYEAFFIPEGKAKRISRMDKAEKAEFSHRAKALRKFAAWFLRK